MLNLFRSLHKMRTLDYENAISALNALQSNASVLNEIRDRRGMCPEMNLLDTKNFLSKTGVEVDDLEKLNVIHVAGTKGKGSVCAMTESLLRHRGYKTGFYSSPHLVHVRERFRINSEPLTEEQFAAYFWPIYNRLKSCCDSDDTVSMPAYFKFLTIMAFRIFLLEKVDVAIIEVGIGGTYDCTNLIKNPLVCGLTTLDFDHISILGKTIEQIAWHKSGIMKPGSVAVTVEQPSNALSVLISRSKELQCPLYRAPLFSTYVRHSTGSDIATLGIPGSHQLENASIALQLVRIWLRRRSDMSYKPATTDPNVALPFLESNELEPVEEKALQLCRWPGRSQTLVRGSIYFYLDGAHTPKSMQVCGEWFRSVTGIRNSDDDVTRVLVFNCTSDRTAQSLLPFLLDCGFHCAVFCPNIIDASVTNLDSLSVAITPESQIKRCEQNRTAWLRLLNKRAQLNAGIDIDGDNRASIESLSGNHHPICYRTSSNESSIEVSDAEVGSVENHVTVIVPCISAALRWISALQHQPGITSANRRTEVLITGSLYLVGGALSILDPQLKG